MSLASCAICDSNVAAFADGAMHMSAMAASMSFRVVTIMAMSFGNCVLVSGKALAAGSSLCQDPRLAPCGSRGSGTASVSN